MLGSKRRMGFWVGSSGVVMAALCLAWPPVFGQTSTPQGTKTPVIAGNFDQVRPSGLLGR